ncbi:MAG: hypothetical protein QOG27_888 [Verrucomicrobiota bacterium]|jgi:hypothetical protein
MLRFNYNLARYSPRMNFSLRITGRGFLSRFVSITSIILLAALSGCSGPRRDIVGKWRADGEGNTMVWEFAESGAVQIGSIRGRYSFGDRDRIKIETSGATSVYQLELAGDHMRLKDPAGSKLGFTRVK